MWRRFDLAGVAFTVPDSKLSVISMISIKCPFLMSIAQFFSRTYMGISASNHVAYGIADSDRRGSCPFGHIPLMCTTGSKIPRNCLNGGWGVAKVEAARLDLECSLCVWCGAA